VSKDAVPFPGITGTLATPIQPLQMQPLHQMIELFQAFIVAVDSIVVVVPTKFGVQQLELFS
jgi:hypothetical protein